MFCPRFAVTPIALSLTLAAGAGGPPAPKPGTLYALRNGYSTPEENLLCTVDPSTAEVLSTVVLSLPGAVISNSTGMARHPTTGVFYAIVRPEATASTGGRPNLLITIDPFSGECAEIGGLGDQFAGLAFLPDGTLLGVTGDGAALPECLFQIDAATGAATFLANLGNGDYGEAIGSAPDGRVFHASGADDITLVNYFERLDLGALTPQTDILTSHEYTFDSEILALGWSSSLVAMFAANSAADLLTVNLGTGEQALIGHMGVRAKGLAFDGVTLYALDNATFGDVELHTIDPALGGVLSSTLVTMAGFEIYGANGLARHPLTGRLYGILQASEVPIADGGDDRRLVTIDPVTGVADHIGGLSDNFAGIAFSADGTLYGVTGDGAILPEALFRIDPANGSSTHLRNLGNGGAGEAIAVAPGPTESDEFLYHASGNSNGDQYFERLGPPTAPFIHDIPVSGGHTFPFDDEILALAWSPFHNRMFLTERGRGLYTIDTQAPASFTLVGATGLYLKGIAFDGATLYALENENQPRLFTLDPDTGGTLTTTPVTLAGFEINRTHGLARHPGSGQLFAILQAANIGLLDYERRLVTLNPATGAATLIGSLPDSFASITFRADGKLFGVTGNGAIVAETLYTIDIATAGVTFIMSLGNGDDGEAIAFGPDSADAATEALYHASGIDSGDQYWERVDPAAQTVEDIPVIGGHNFPYREALAMDFSGAHGLMFISDLDGGLYTLDVENGVPAHIGDFHFADGAGDGSLSMKGLVFIPAPPCPGDANGDNVVDFADLNIVLTNFGAVGPNIPGDLDNDDDVDFADLNTVLTFYGQAC